jgi:hypothetical protein
MAITLNRSTFWWLTMFASVLLLPLLPSLAVIVIGLFLPGSIPWSFANAAIVVGALFAVCVCAFLLRYRRWSILLRSLVFALVALFMAGFSQIEFFTSQACVTQQGKYIDLQRQYREIQAAQGGSCGD